MRLSFLPEQIKNALAHLNYNFLTEIRLRRGQPVIIGYDGAYRYLGVNGVCQKCASALKIGEVTPVLNAATEGCVYAYTEQMKNGFITVEHGVRIGIAGEYVTQNGCAQAVRNVTSLNVRIPHDVVGCAREICDTLYTDNTPSLLIFAKPALGKTTMLRDIARFLSRERALNVLVFDERGEIAAIDGHGNGFDIGERADVVRCYNKRSAIAAAIRAMRPDAIVTDELYGEEDIAAVRYAADCGIAIVASSHTVDRERLRGLPFDYFVCLTKLGGQPEIYDKNFIAYRPCGADDRHRNFSLVEKEKENAGFQRPL